MANNTNDLRIDQLLSHDGAGFGVGLVVLRHHFKLDFLAADFNAFRVSVINGEPSSIFIVLAKVSHGAGERGNVADFYDLNSWRRWCGWRRSWRRGFGRFRWGRLFLLPATAECYYCN